MPPTKVPQASRPVGQYWTTKMIRAMFDYIEEKKGEDSIMKRHHQTALEEIRARLKPLTKDKTDFARLTPVSIDGKLHKTVGRAGLPQGGIERLYFEGISVLQLENLPKGCFTETEINASKKRRRDLSSTRGRQRHVKDETNRNSTRSVKRQMKADEDTRETNNSSRKKRRVMEDDDDYTPENVKGKSIGLKPYDPETEFESVSEDNPTDTNDDDGQAQTMCTHCQANVLDCDFKTPCTCCRKAKKSCQYPEDYQKSEADAHIPSQLPRFVRSTTEPRSPDIGPGLSSLETTVENNHHVKDNHTDIVRSTFVCEYCQASFDDPATLLGHKTTHFQQSLLFGTFQCGQHKCHAHFDSAESLERHKEMHAFVVKVPVKPRGVNSDIDEASRSTEAHQGIEELVLPGQASFYTDVRTVQKDIENIQREIFDATTQYFSSSSLEQLSSARGFRLKHCKQPLVDLIGMIYGSGAVDERELFERRIDDQHSQLPLQDLVMSIIGCAVTRWVLMPPPAGETTRGLLSEVVDVLSEESLALHDNIMERATRKYLASYIKPQIPKVAHTMAAEILHLLDAIIPSAARFTGQTWLSHDQGESKLRNPLDVHNSSDTTMHTWPLQDRDTPKQEFLRALECQVFGPALKLRVDMAMSQGAQWSFFFPMVGTPVDQYQHSVLKRGSCKEQGGKGIGKTTDETAWEFPNLRAEAVAVGLSPIVWGQFKKTKDELWGDGWDMVVKGRVYVQS